MKKLVSIAMALMVALALAGCAANEPIEGLEDMEGTSSSLAETSSAPSN